MPLLVRTIRAAFVFIHVAAFALPTVAQTTVSEVFLRGRVVDESGAQFPNAKISAQCGAYRADSTSGADGSFVVPVKESTCTVTTTAPNFAPVSRVWSSRDVEVEGFTILMRIPGSSSAIDVSARQDTVDVSKINADPMDLPLAIQTVPAQLPQEQGFIRLLDAVRNVSGVTSKEAYMGVTDNFNIRGFDASSS